MCVTGADLPVPLFFIRGNLKVRPHATSLNDTLDCLESPVYSWSLPIDFNVFQKFTKKYISEVN